MLNEKRFDAPVIHVVSESPRLEMLQTRLRQAGLRPVPVRGSYLPPDAAPALIDALTLRNNLEGFENRLIIMIGKSKAGAADIHLADVSQIESLPARIAIRQRETQRQREIQLRARTAQKLGARQSVSTPTIRARLLWLGQDAPFLNAIKASLGEGAVTLVAAISRLTAEDYLTSGGFQTLVLCPASPEDEAAKLLASVKTLSTPISPRVVLLLRPELTKQIDSAALAQADQIIDLTAEVDVLAEQLQTIASDSVSTLETGHAAQAGVEDRATGLVSREYLESHVQAQMQQADEFVSALSVIAFKLSGSTDLRHVAQVIRSHLRDTDLAGRLDANHICITLPETDYRGAVILARRIEEALDGSVTWRAIERRQFHTLKTLLGGLTAKSLLTKKRTA